MCHSSQEEGGSREVESVCLIKHNFPCRGFSTIMSHDNIPNASVYSFLAVLANFFPVDLLGSLVSLSDNAKNLGVAFDSYFKNILGSRVCRLQSVFH